MGFREYLNGLNEARKYAVYFDLDKNKARKIVIELNKLGEKIVNKYAYIEFAFDDVSETDGKAKVFNMMYGDELIYDIEYEQTLKNLKSNSSFKIKDGKDEAYFFKLIQYGDPVPASYWMSV